MVRAAQGRSGISFGEVSTQKIFTNIMRFYPIISFLLVDNMPYSPFQINNNIKEQKIHSSAGVMMS